MARNNSAFGFGNTQSNQVTVSCNGCGRSCSVDVTYADEFGGRHTCNYCENDAMPPEALNDDEAPVVEPSEYV